MLLQAVVGGGKGGGRRSSSHARPLAPLAMLPLLLLVLSPLWTAGFSPALNVPEAVLPRQHGGAASHLLTYLGTRGYRGEKVGVGLFDGGLRGVVALEPIEEGDHLMQIPWDVSLVVRESDRHAPRGGAYAQLGIEVRRQMISRAYPPTFTNLRHPCSSFPPLSREREGM